MLSIFPAKRPLRVDLLAKNTFMFGPRVDFLAKFTILFGLLGMNLYGIWQIQNVEQVRPVSVPTLPASETINKFNKK